MFYSKIDIDYWYFFVYLIFFFYKSRETRQLCTISVKATCSVDVNKVSPMRRKLCDMWVVDTYNMCPSLPPPPPRRPAAPHPSPPWLSGALARRRPVCPHGKFIPTLFPRILEFLPLNTDFIVLKYDLLSYTAHREDKGALAILSKTNPNSRGI